MYLRKPSSQPKLTVLAVLLLLFVATSVKTVLSKAFQEESTAQIVNGDKKLAIGIPKHVPLKVKVKNLNNEKWAHDLEVEVTNTSDKPIYFLSMYLRLPGIKSLSGSDVGFWLHYGRGELNRFSTSLKPEDVPIEPGQEYTLKIDESSAKGWDHLRDKENRPEPKTLKLIFQVLNFGDGTGYTDTSGSPVNIHRKVNLNQKCLPSRDHSSNSMQPTHYLLPGAFRQVEFSMVDIFRLPPRKSLLQESGD